MLIAATSRLAASAGRGGMDAFVETAAAFGVVLFWVFICLLIVLSVAHFVRGPEE